MATATYDESESSVGRPQYESDKDRYIEERLIEAFLRDGCTYRKLPAGGRYTIDYACYDEKGRLEAMVEVKNRPGWKREYGDVILSLAKAHELREYEERSICTAFFLVALGVKGKPGAGVYYYRFNEPPGSWVIRHGGRDDRDDPYDTEPVMHIPMSKLMRFVL